MKLNLACFTGIPAAVLLMAGLAACSSEAADSAGSITAMIDGKPYSAITFSGTSSRDSSAEFNTIGGMTLISIQGHDLDTGGIMDNVINLEISLMGTDATAQVYEASMMYWPEGMSGPFYTNEETGNSVALDWDELTLGDSAMARGRFESMLCLKESYFAEADMDNCIDVSGDFDTALTESDY